MPALALVVESYQFDMDLLLPWISADLANAAAVASPAASLLASLSQCEAGSASASEDVFVVARPFSEEVLVVERAASEEVFVVEQACFSTNASVELYVVDWQMLVVE